MDWLASVFLGAFLFGLLVCLATVFFGLTDFGLDDLGIGDPGDGGAGGVSPWNLTALTAFVAWFGGVGYLALTGWQLAAWLSLVLALAAGLAGWWLIYLFLAKVLARGEHRMEEADYRMEGTVARVSQAIGPSRIGEIQFSRGGSRRSEGARSVGGEAIGQGEEVVIMRYERGLAYVQPWREFVGEEASAGR